MTQFAYDIAKELRAAHDALVTVTHLLPKPSAERELVVFARLSLEDAWDTSDGNLSDDGRFALPTDPDSMSGGVDMAVDRMLEDNMDARGAA